MKLSTVRRRGFTLVELLVVIAIIGILVGISLPVLASRKNSRSRNPDVAAFFERPLKTVFLKDNRFRDETVLVLPFLVGILWFGKRRDDAPEPRRTRFTIDEVSVGTVNAHRNDSERDRRRKLSASVQLAINNEARLGITKDDVSVLQDFQAVFDEYMLNLEQEIPNEYDGLVDVVWLLTRYELIQKILQKANLLDGDGYEGGVEVGVGDEEDAV